MIYKTKYTKKMGITYIRASIVALLAGYLLIATGNCRAGDSENRFSLGYGSLTQAPADARFPADAKASASGLLTAKYGFGPAREFKPYLGTGLSYAIQPDIRPGDTTRIKAGLGAQAGFSYLLGENSALKFDYKVLTITPDSSRDPKSPPQSIGVGVDIKF